MFIVRTGNPKGIKDWGDLAKPGVAVITPNPKTSGGARWNYLAAYGWALDQFGGDEAKAKAYLGDLFRNVPVLDTGARGSTTTFAQRGFGDVFLLAWENEAFLVLNEFGADKFEIVVPIHEHLGRAAGALSLTAMSTPRERARWRRPISSSSTRRRARRWPPSTTIGRASPNYASAEDLARFPKIELFGIDRFGGWKEAQATHFGDGGVFDQIYKPTN